MHTIPQNPKTSCTTLALVRTPGGAVVGRIELRNGERVFVRSISRANRPKVLFRALDAWPCGEFALGQLQKWQVSRLCYRAPEGPYEVPLGEFLARATRKPFPHEAQYLLPRASWPVRPDESIGEPEESQLPLFEASA